ncbi:MAG: hypothetical protein EOP06_32145 [Proteobacteria bacterium]|nr:MAG: hypothetical protein EOP06_32145 [Pseudomonadota bacterium]
MRFRISLWTLGVVGASVCCASQPLQAGPVAKGRNITPKGTTSFTSQTHAFSVWLPTQPTQSSEAWYTGVGDSEPTSFGFEAIVKPIIYRITVTPHRSGKAPSNPNKELNLIQQKFLDNPSDAFLKKESIQLTGFWGRDIKTNWMGGQRVTRVRLYLTPKNLYEIVVSGPKAQMQKQDKQIDRVFDSFRILPQ